MNRLSSTLLNTQSPITFLRSIRGKLIMLFVTVSLIPLVVVGWIAITQLNVAKSATFVVTQNYLPSLVSLNDAETALRNITEAQKALAPDDANRKMREQEINKQQQNLYQALTRFETTLEEGEETKTFKQFQRLLEDFWQVNDQMILLSQSHHNEKAQALRDGNLNDLFKEALRFLASLRETNVTGSEKAQILADNATRFGKTQILFIIVIIMVVVMSMAIWVTYFIAKPISVVSKMAHKFSLGEVELTRTDKKEIGKIMARQDEIGNIARSFDSLANYFQLVIDDIVNVSQGLAKGNLHVTLQSEYQGDFLKIKNGLEQSSTYLREVIEDIVQVSQGLAEGGWGVMPEAEYQGDFVQIQDALEITATTLAEATIKDTTQDWIKTGQTQLSDCMRGDQDIVILAKNIIAFLTTYLGAQIGLFYVLKEPKQPEQPSYLKVIASYAYTANEKIPSEFLLGEGLIGQVALEKKSLFRTHSPEEYTHIIQSSLASAVPRHVFIIPFLYENAVKGVIELGCAKPLTDVQREFMEQVMLNVGIAVNAAESRTKMQMLLQKSQQQSEELQTQQKQLQQTNEELQQQREKLQQKQEELQHRNEELQSQSEELQSQSEELQTQQEELTQTNEALQERTKESERQKEDVQQKNIVLEKTQVEMKQAQAAIEAKAQELELVSRYKSEFLANMSHELRTPLNSLLILAQLLAENKSKNLDDKQVEYARTIHGSGLDLLKLINEILDLSKVEAGKIELHLEEVLLEELVENLNHEFRPVAIEKGLAFQITLASELSSQTLQTDGQRLKQIINNLLSNALKFTSQGEVKLDIQRVNPEELEIKWEDLKIPKTPLIALSVTDTGIGIPEDKQQIIFEAFQQVDGTTSRRYGGTGLGLSISRQFTRLLGGELFLHSEENKGSTFTLYLPESLNSDKKSVLHNRKISPSSQTTETPIVAIPLSEKIEVPLVETEAVNTTIEEITDDRAEIKPEDKSLLIIENDLKFVEILMELAREKDFKCIVAEDGKTGLHFAQAYQPHAIILDIGLPQVDGWTVMEKLKDNPNTRHIPVHFISGSDHSLEAKKMGAIGYLLKPVSMEQLGEAFKQIEQFLTKTVKNLLIVVNSEPHQQQIMELVGGGEIQATLAITIQVALQHIKNAVFDCMILDMDIEQGSGLKLLEQMQTDEALCKTPMIIYADRELTSSEEALLLQYADHLPLKSVHSPARLLDETTLFLHQLEAKLPTDKRRMLRMVHDKEAILAHKKVLIVDDDARNTFALATILEEKNMEVIAGETGQEALELLDENPETNIILMDIMMPEMDGYKAMQQIRAQQRFQQLPIIALTAKAMKGDKAKCIQAGANDYLSKPVDTDKLISLMRVWLYR